MRIPRLRFSLKMLLVSVALVAISSFWLMLPTVRARHFVQLIDAGDLRAAEAMLPASMTEISHHRQTVHNAAGASLQKMTLDEVLRGERCVIVTEKPEIFEDGTESDQATGGFIITRQSIEPSWHSFNQW